MENWKMPDHNPQPAHVGCATRAVMLETVVNRIARKAEIMALDAARSSSARQDAEEIRALAGIAIRCLEAADAQ